AMARGGRRRLVVTDLSAEIPTDVTAYSLTTPHSATAVQLELELADHPGLTPLKLSFLLGFAVTISLLPACAAAALCLYANAWTWVTVSLPVAVGVGTAFGAIRYMEGRISTIGKRSLDQGSGVVAQSEVGPNPPADPRA